MNKDLSYFMSICSRREYCTQDILKKCLKRNIPVEKSDEIIRILIKENFLDDLRYTNSYIRDKSLISGWGPVKIRYFLKSKNISENIINSALENMDIDDLRRADKRLSEILNRKWESYKKEKVDNYILKQKLIKFAANRGYRYNQIKSFLDTLS